MPREYVADLLRDSFISLKPWFDENKVGALALRSYRRHGRTHTERSGLVTRCGDNATFGRATYSYRLAAQVGVIALFHTGVKRIHIDMDNLADDSGIAFHHRRTLKTLTPTATPYGQVYRSSFLANHP